MSLNQTYRGIGHSQKWNEEIPTPSDRLIRFWANDHSNNMKQQQHAIQRNVKVNISPNSWHRLTPASFNHSLTPFSLTAIESHIDADVRQEKRFLHPYPEVWSWVTSGDEAGDEAVALPGSWWCLCVGWERRDVLQARNKKQQEFYFTDCRDNTHTRSIGQHREDGTHGDHNTDLIPAEPLFQLLIQTRISRLCQGERVVHLFSYGFTSS